MPMDAATPEKSIILLFQYGERARHGGEGDSMFTARRAVQAIHVKRTRIWRQSGFPSKNAARPALRHREPYAVGAAPAARAVQRTAMVYATIRRSVINP
jgi:hypothetical protein